MNPFMRAISALFCALALCVTGCANRAVPNGITVLTYASPYSPAHPFSRADITWIKWVERRSGGTLRIQPYWSGSLLSSEQSLTELRHGVADIGLITPIYSRGGTQLIRVQAGFYGGAVTYAQQTAVYRCLVAAEPEFSRELQGLKVLAVQGGNLPGVVTRDRPVRSLADLRGLRLRAPSELLTVLEDLGADPVDMPMGEVYSALAKGVLDGVVAPADTLRSLHFAEVAHYFNTIAIPRGAYAARAMGEKRWSQLTPDQRQLLEDGIPVWENALAAEISAANSAGERAGHDQGVTFLSMPPQDQARFDEIYERDGARRAKSLERYGIDGLATFRRARAIARTASAAGTVECNRGHDGSTS
jgi:TRAP-type C4-dicarboxylate transport system substrate-binding protein